MNVNEKYKGVGSFAIVRYKHRSSLEWEGYTWIGWGRDKEDLKYLLGSQKRFSPSTIFNVLREVHNVNTDLVKLKVEEILDRLTRGESVDLETFLEA